MASAAEAEMTALKITSRKMILLCNTLIEMGCPQAKTLIQTDNSTAVGFTNKTIVLKTDQIGRHETMVAKRQRISGTI